MSPEEVLARAQLQGRPANLASPGVQGLSDLIAEAEGTSDRAAQANGFRSGYDIPYNSGRGYGRPDKPLSEMTLDEIDRFQGRMPTNRTPVGRPQIVRRTLRDERQRLNLRGDDLFGRELQDLLLLDRLRFRGIDDYRAGKIDDAAFQENLADEWDSFASSKTGRSKHGKRTGATTDQIRQALHRLRPGF